MMLPHDQMDHAEARRPDSTEPFRPGGILLVGYLRKLKRMKKKYFILFGESESIPARLEYFDSEKKWRNGQAAKKSIPVKSCFNINRRTDCKQSKLVVALYTIDDCFPIAFESEEELVKWFLTLLKIQLADRVAEGEELKPIYEHVWQVTVRDKELGNRKNIRGAYRLCLNTTTRILTLYKLPMIEPVEMWEFPVMTIRRCGHSHCQFFMEMGRATATGAGELWMDLEDTSVAQHVHGAIIDAMRNSAKEDVQVVPRQRTRSSSMNANEQNKPWTAQQTLAVGPAVVHRNRADSVPSRSGWGSESLVVTPPDGRPASVHYDAMPSPPGYDDLDGPPANHYQSTRLSHTPGNSLPKESTILEEGGENSYLLMNYGQDQQDYLSMTPKANLSSSPHSVSSRRSYNNKSRVTPPIKPPLHPQNPYLDMSSPSWASPPTAVHDGYMPMYPSSGPGSVGTRSGMHTRSSSFCEDVPESYVPMAPQSVASSVTSEDPGSYMDMQTYRRSVPRDAHLRGRQSPASGSSLASSFTSGTPPVGSMSRFAEYGHLEKVASFLTEDEDSVSSLRGRQSRAYSVGSKPDARIRKMAAVPHDLPVPPSSNSASPSHQTAAQMASLDARVRAYSVGSRVSPGMNKLQSGSNNNSVNSSRNELEQAAVNAEQQDERKKSLSVPVLAANPALPNPTGTFLRTLMTQQTPRRDDMMEIEFNGLNTSADSLGIDQVDGTTPSSYGAHFGSTDSVGRASVGSTSSSGRPRSASNQSRPGSLNRNVKSKLESIRSRDNKTRLERLESVPQGRDQDYIEYGDSRQQQFKSLDSPARTDHDSGDEYVELAQPGSRNSLLKLTIPEQQQQQSADYMAMTSSTLNTVLCQLTNEPDPKSAYIDMNYNSKRTLSQPSSVSEDFGYLPMDFTPKSSRNPSRQSSQADLLMATGAVSPSVRGSQTPRSDSARHSRTEESLMQEQHYMEMTFDIPTNKRNEAAANEPEALLHQSKSSKASAFLSSLLGRKPSNASGSKPVVPVDTGTLPRSSRSMPPSPFSSLKRPSKSTKKRTATVAQSLSPVSPDVEMAPAMFYHQRSQSLRSGTLPSQRINSPMTPPSPSADFAFSPPVPKPGSSQPISISRPSSYTPRGSLHNLNLRAEQEVEFAHHSRYSASPGRLITMPTLSPLPEVLLTSKQAKSVEKATPAGNEGYMNMDFKPTTAKFIFEQQQPVPGRLESSQPVWIPLKANEDKENAVVVKAVETEVPAAAAVPAVAAPAKQRANSLEKIVCAFEKVKIGPKRHSSGDKPLKRPSGTLIYRSNSYQPSSNASRVVVAGTKPASPFPLLSDIPAGKVMTTTSSSSLSETNKQSKSPPGQLTHSSTSRTSSSSLASLGEDSMAGELQTVYWDSTPSVASSSPSPIVISRPTSVLSEREIHYAQLDLSRPAEDVVVDEAPKSPRIPRPISGVETAPPASTSYAQIDFNKSDGLKSVTATRP